MSLFHVAVAVVADGGLAALASTRRPLLALGSGSAVLGCAIGLAPALEVLLS